MTEMKFEKKIEPSDDWDKNGITIKFCPDYKKRLFSKKCKLQDQCKNAKKVRHVHVNSRGETVVNFYPIECDGKTFICNYCKRTHQHWGDAAACFHNHKVKAKRNINPERMDHLEKGAHIGKSREIK